MDKSKDPSTPSIAYNELHDAWEMIEAIREGAKAVREGGTRYLQQFPSEDDDEYKRRLKSAPWRPEFVDAVQKLSAKPFTKEVKLTAGASPEFEAIASDVDGRGNNLHVFAKDVFEGGVSMGAHGILVDFPTKTNAITRAQERAQGIRPYWVAIDADDILELTTEQRGGRRVVVYLRIKESKIVKNGFEQKCVELIREITAGVGGAPGSYRIWREEKRDGKTEWVIDDEGVMTLDEVAFVYFATGDMEGDQYVKPPLIDLADMQIELYNALSKKEQTFTMAASPMLTANGMAPPENGASIQTGPARVLYAPGAEGVNTSWDYIQPNAANLKEIREDIREIIEDMRRIGMQPMMQKAGNTPALAYQFDGEQSFTVLQAWALTLKDALEQAFVFTAKWMNNEAAAPKVSVHTDFVVGLYGSQEVSVLLEARKEAQISQETYWDEMQRRGVLGPQFDREAEKKRLAAENPPFDPTGVLDQPPDPNAA